MDRQRATELVELVLRDLDAQLDQWPLTLTTEVYVFGSFAGGAFDPHDLDLDIEHEHVRPGKDRHFMRGGGRARS
ncbi:MAG: hypothetical protein JWN00_5627 [Actinomycetia bacterium]|nr:hypothetical protein [Actinomycetes bacterium]